LASTHGNCQLFLPIVDRTLEVGGCENYHALETSGLRTFFSNIFYLSIDTPI
jgi:hypothetical protein